jgi:hypothetical protein
VFKKNHPCLFTICILITFFLAGCGGTDKVTYSVGGSVTGLVGSVVLLNNLSDELTVTAGGKFTFTQKVDSGSSYSVSVLTQPIGQTCLVNSGSDTITTDISNVVVVCSFNSYSVSGSAADLVGSLVLQNNLGDNLTVTTDETFTFSQTIDSGSDYNITVLTQPIGQTCSVNEGNGIMVANNVTDVAVVCSFNSYSLKGVLTGLTAGNSITVTNNGIDNITLVADGEFTFETPLVYGTSFQVTLSTTTPSSQPCISTYNVGSINADNFTSLKVICGVEGGIAAFTDTGFPILSGRNIHTATLLPNGNVLASAGRDEVGTSVASAELYDPTTGQWTATGPLAESRQSHSAMLLPSGKVLVTGGQNSTGLLAGAELYDPTTGQWEDTGPLAQRRDNHTSTLLVNGLVLVSGGQHSEGTCELYDSSTGNWRSTGSLAQTRYGHTATLLPNGKVLVSGGWSGFGYLASAELYDPSTGEWSAAGSMAETRTDHTATLLPNGLVLISGGSGDTAYELVEAELYDPVTGQWSNTGSMSDGRSNHTTTLLPSGLVLSTGSNTASAELYDPATGAWTNANSMASTRTHHTSTLLVNGEVLVNGGGFTGAAELYW